MVVPIDVRSMDFSALESGRQPPPPLAAGEREGPPVLELAIGLGIAALTLLVIGVLAVGFLTGGIPLDPGPGPVVNAVAAFAILVGIVAIALGRVVLAVSARVRVPQQPDRFERFAAANRFAHAPLDRWPVLAGSVMENADAHLLHGFHPIDGDDFVYGTLSAPEPGSIEGRQWGFLTVRLERELPHLLLNTVPFPRLARRDDFAVVELPGQYGRRFELRAEPGGEAEARRLFTPALLTLITGRRNAFDVEVVGDRLYAYGDALDLRLAAVHKRFLQITKIVWERVGPPSVGRPTRDL